MKYQTAQQGREAGICYHLVPEEIWNARKDQPTYKPDAFEADGFIHCTNGLEPLRDVGNMFYRSDLQPHLVLVLSVRAITADLRYDDPERIYPHIYGALNTDAVVGVLDVVRDDDGRFVDFREQQ